MALRKYVLSGLGRFEIVIWSTLSPSQCQGNMIYDNVISRLSISRLLVTLSGTRGQNKLNQVVVFMRFLGLKANQ